MKKFKHFFLIFLSMAISILWSCKDGNNQSENIVDDETGINIEEVEMSGNLVNNAGIILGKIEEKKLSDDVKARGKLVLPPESHASVSSPIEGIITRIRIKTGNFVNKGDVLCWLSHPDLIELQHSYLIAKSQFDFLEQDFQRQTELYGENINSLKKLQEAEAVYLEAKSNYLSDKAALELLKIDPIDVENGEILKELEIYSPISGYVDEIATYIGKYVVQSDNLFNIVNNNNLFVELSVFEKDIVKINKGQEVTFIIPNIGQQIFTSKVTSISKTVRELSRVVKVIADFKNTDSNLFPGMFVSGTIHTGEQTVNAIPENAIIYEGNNNKYIFYTLSDDGDDPMIFKKIYLLTGLAEEGFVQVTLVDKLPEEARIVIDGGYYIKAEMLKGEE